MKMEHLISTAFLAQSADRKIPSKQFDLRLYFQGDKSIPLEHIQKQLCSCLQHWFDTLELEPIADQLFSMTESLLDGWGCKILKLELYESPELLLIVSNSDKLPLDNNLSSATALDISMESLPIKIPKDNPQTNIRRRLAWESPIYLAVGILFLLLCGFGLVAAVQYWAAYPVGDQSWQHLRLGIFLKNSIERGDWYPLYTDQFGIGIQPFRTTSPLCYYLLALLSKLSGSGEDSYVWFLGITLFTGASGWLYFGYLRHRLVSGLLLGIGWFLFPVQIFLVSNTSELPFMLACAFLPWLICCKMQFISTGKCRYFVGCTLWLSLILLTEWQCGLLWLACLILFFLGSAMVLKSLRIAVFGLLGGLICLVLTSAWLLPAVTGGLLEQAPWKDWSFYLPLLVYAEGLLPMAILCHGHSSRGTSVILWSMSVLLLLVMPVYKLPDVVYENQITNERAQEQNDQLLIRKAEKLTSQRILYAGSEEKGDFFAPEVLIDTLQNGYYTSFFQQCLRYGGDSVLIEKSLLADPELLLEFGEKTGYRKTAENRNLLLLHKQMSPRFGVAGEFNGFAIGDDGQALASLFPSVLPGTGRLTDYPAEELKHYSLIYLSDAGHGQFRETEALIEELVQSGVRVVVQLDTGERLFGVRGESIQLADPAQSLFYQGVELSAPSDYNGQVAAVLDGLSSVMGTIGEGSAFIGDLGQSKLTFLGLDLVQYAFDTGDTSLKEILAEVLKLDPTSGFIDPIPLQVSHRPGQMTITAGRQGVQTTLAYQDIFYSDQKIHQEHGFLVLDEGAATIQFRLPNQQLGYLVSYVGFITLFLLVLFLWRGRKSGEGAKFER